ncbi:MAG: glucose-6-phosphate dehydrogenase [Desulfobacteria bacterium]
MNSKQTERPCDFVLFGTLGDLARRKLLPCLYQLEKAELIHPDTRIIGVARGEMSGEEYVNAVRESLKTFLKEDISDAIWSRLSHRLNYRQIDMTASEDYARFKDIIDQHQRVMVNYFAVPPAIYGAICKGLHKSGMITPETRVVLEKPIGHDLASSKVIDDEVGRYFTEEQVYRIDHYLGKETVLNLVVLRFANLIFASHWDRTTIDHVQITVAEEVGIEGRWGYFDKSGQLRDMVQNHLLQILTLVAMEPPAKLNAANVRNEKLRVLKALRPITIHSVREKTVRGQYGAGFMKGGPAPGYLEEDDARTESSTETFVAIRADIDNWRWAGVPFYLRTGKRMVSKRTEVAICFKQLPHNVFEESYRRPPTNKLIIRLQPNEGVDVHMLNKVPGVEESFRMQETKLDLSFSEAFSKERIADAYERLLLNIMLGNQALFIHRDEVEQAWKWIDSIQEAWQMSGEPVTTYPAGTWGPVASIALITRDGRFWHE